MPRYFVYVNTNNDRKHITLHCENRGVCSHIFKHTKKGGRNEEKFYIEELNDSGTFKTADKDNSYWLIVLANSPLDALKNKYVREARKELEVCCCVCDHCI